MKQQQQKAKNLSGVSEWVLEWPASWPVSDATTLWQNLGTCVQNNKNLCAAYSDLAILPQPWKNNRGCVKRLACKCKQIWLSGYFYNSQNLETILKYLELAKHIIAYLSDKMLLLNIT